MDLEVSLGGVAIRHGSEDEAVRLAKKAGHYQLLFSCYSKEKTCPEEAKPLDP